MNRVILFVKHKRLHELAFERGESLDAVAYCGSDYAWNDEPCRRSSVTGGATMRTGACVSLIPTRQRCDQESVTEVEYVVMEGVAKEAMHVWDYPGVSILEEEGDLLEQRRIINAGSRDAVNPSIPARGPYIGDTIPCRVSCSPPPPTQG